MGSRATRTFASFAQKGLFQSRQFILSRPQHRSFQNSLSQLQRKKPSDLAAKVSAVKQLLSNGSGPASPIGIDPLRTVAKQMKSLTKDIQRHIGSGLPMLDRAAKYYTQSEGKYVRPTIVLLMSRATGLTPQILRPEGIHSQQLIDTPISPPSILNDENPHAPDFGPRSVEPCGKQSEPPGQELEDSTSSPSPLPNDSNPPAPEGTSLTEPDDSFSDILPAQRRLAEITELIHTASLLHDDVIDNAVTRRSQPSANIVFGNKMAVLAGDFLLGRASAALSRLRDPEVIELLSTVIANLVDGELMQLKNTEEDETRPVYTPDTLEYYLQKTYLKTASLISNSCRAAALLGHSAPEVQDAAYAYGKNLGLAFQLVDDMLDYTISGEELGKPAGADLELGLATAPLLFAWEKNAELGALVGRKFSQEGDVPRARELVLRSDGLKKTQTLAQSYVDRASNAISAFPESEAKEGLIEMCNKVMKRRK